MIVALIGGALGVLIGVWGIDALRAANPGDAAKFAPGWNGLGINFPVLAFTTLLAIFSGLVFGLAPALQISKPNLNDAIKEGSRQSSGRSHGLSRAKARMPRSIPTVASKAIRSRHPGFGP